MSRIEELEKILDEMTAEEGVRRCAHCGIPFMPMRDTQITCGDRICVAANRKAKAQEWRLKNKGRVNARRNERRKNERVRKNIFKIAEQEEARRIAIEYQLKQVRADKIMSERGTKYGEIQAQKILENAPKVKVEL